MVGIPLDLSQTCPAERRTIVKLRKPGGNDANTGTRMVNPPFWRACPMTSTRYRPTMETLENRLAPSAIHIGTTLLAPSHFAQHDGGTLIHPAGKPQTGPSSSSDVGVRIDPDG
jgi:hypothetical protein